VGKPFRLELNGAKATREVRQQIADEIMMRIAELMPREYRGEYETFSMEGMSFTRVVE
jgi:hypothetical protein